MEFNTNTLIIYSTLVILVILVIYILTRLKKNHENFDVNNNNNNTAAIKNLSTIATKLMTKNTDGNTGILTIPADTIVFKGDANINGSLTAGSINTTGALTADTINTTGALTGATINTTGALTADTINTTGNITIAGNLFLTKTVVTMNATATATADQVASGYIAFASTAGVEQQITMPSGTLLGPKLGAIQGTVFDLLIDNISGQTNLRILNSTDQTGIGSAGLGAEESIQNIATLANVYYGMGNMFYPAPMALGRFTLIFSTPTSYVFSRTA